MRVLQSGTTPQLLHKCSFKTFQTGNNRLQQIGPLHSNNTALFYFPLTTTYFITVKDCLVQVQGPKYINLDSLVQLQLKLFITCIVSDFSWKNNTFSFSKQLAGLNYVFIRWGLRLWPTTVHIFVCFDLWDSAECD